MSYAVTLRDGLECRGIEVAEFTARIRFGWIEELVGTWHDEPPHAAYGELYDVTQLTGPTLPDDKLAEWAHDWLSEQSELDEALFRDGGWACAQREAQEQRKRVAAARKAKIGEGSRA